MNLQSELINYAAFLLPLLVASASLFLRGESPPRRLIRVVVPAFCSVLVVGFGLQGLVRNCFDTVPMCPNHSHAVPMVGNAFGSQIDCMACVPLQGLLAYTLNSSRPYAVVIASVMACQISAFAIILFAQWVRRGS